MQYVANDLFDYPKIVESILTKFPTERIFLLHGEMGVGKTTLTKCFLKSIGAEEEGASPTFGIVNEYKGRSNPIYHFDCYRLKSEEEALSIGWFDYIDSGNYCFIEWPERVEEILPEEFVLLKLRLDNGIRIIELEKISS
jgi:tRNA threonylcarbamoyladenosine biosynthesis protein TsaE